MKNQTQDALLATIEGICRHCAELSRKARMMELLLSRHNKAAYQEYMDQVVAAGNPELPEDMQKALDSLRQACLRDQE